MNKIASAGKYVAYPEYKSSGVEWLGDMPVHWLTTKIKYGYDITLGKMLQKEAKSSEDSFRPYLKAINIQSYGVSLKQVGKMWFSPSDLRSLKLIDGDILISEGGDVGRSAIWRNELPDCYIQNAINRARPKMNRSSRFLFYWVNMLKGSDYIDILCNKATISHYTVEKLENSPLLIPSDDEAEKIANFLDHETAKIDTLIDKQQQLIKLLKEKRQAVISHAVTKGLNHDAAMKDSGVEWLGEVPEHWTVGRLKNVLRMRNGKDYKDVEVEEGGYPVYGSGGIFKRSSDYLYDGKSVLFGRKGTIDKPLVVSGKFWTVDTMFYSEVLQNALPEYIYFQASMFPFSLLSTNTALPSMTQADLLELPFVIPPYKEQSEINLIIQQKTNEYNLLIGKAEHAIGLMVERRTALISAAVTGKIDVRNWVMPTSSLSQGVMND
tara:strand:+ start:16749 stop:18059 length:1311 start_codon:yes stop_codon:yes gene_type:complete